MSGFSHPNFGHEVRIETSGKEVRLIFVASTEAQANSLADALLAQAKQGAFAITLMGKPTSITETNT